VVHLATEHRDEYWTEECKRLLKAISVALDSGIIVK